MDGTFTAAGTDTLLAETNGKEQPGVHTNGMMKKGAVGERRWMPVYILVVLAVELVTGVFMYAVTSNGPSAIMVVLHSLLGLSVAINALRFPVRVLRGRDSHYRELPFLGTMTFFSAVAVILSGCGLAYQSFFSAEIRTGMDLVHLVSVLLFVGFAIPTIFRIIAHHRK